MKHSGASITPRLHPAPASTWTNTTDVSRFPSGSAISCPNFCCEGLRRCQRGCCLPHAPHTRLAWRQPASISSHGFPLVELLSFQITFIFLPGRVIWAVSAGWGTFNRQHSALHDPAAPQPRACRSAARRSTKPAACAWAHTSHFWPCFITLSPASSPRVNLMCLRTDDQPQLPAVLPNVLQAESLALFHLWGFCRSPLTLPGTQSTQSDITARHRGCSSLYSHPRVAYCFGTRRLSAKVSTNVPKVLVSLLQDD